MTEKWLAGHFLVASRYLRDPNFAQSVVLMIHHDHQGAMGVVINRPSDKTVREVWEMIGNDPCDRDEPIFVGGPVPGPLVGTPLAASIFRSSGDARACLFDEPRRARPDCAQEKRSSSGCAAAMRVGAAGNWKARWKPAAGCGRGPR